MITNWKSFALKEDSLKKHTLSFVNVGYALYVRTLP